MKLTKLEKIENRSKMINKYESLGYKKVPGLTMYYVSKKGEVFSLHRIGRMNGKLKKLLPSKQNTGYLSVAICENNREKTTPIQYLVLETFVGPRPKGHQASHLNGVRDDNRLSNLKWETPVENNARKIEHKTALFGEKHQNSKITDNDVRYLRKNYKVFSPRRTNIKELAAKVGLTRQTIQTIISGKGWPHVK